MLVIDDNRAQRRWGYSSGEGSVRNAVILVALVLPARLLNAQEVRYLKAKGRKSVRLNDCKHEK
jgi:hypothetical protein